MRYLILILPCLLACNNVKIDMEKDSKEKKGLSGVYKLVSYQTQEDTVFEKMEGVEILKIFTDSQWISPAYLSRNNKVVNTAGGTYTFSDGIMKETLLYHSKDTLNKGLVSSYKVKLIGDSLYQSGVYKAGTPDEWKIEEYWIRIE
jgi:hypothetical protein